MKKLFCILLCVFVLLLCSSCSLFAQKTSSFSIEFIDVGQGDAAIVECDGHYMLIDGGDTVAGEKVYNALEKNGIQKLDILAISHLHSDHIGGLTKALTYASSIKMTISNSEATDSKVFRDFEHQLGINDATIRVPKVGDKYSLGSAEVRVLDVSDVEDNDSLVLLITYGKTTFLFTGDIGKNAQRRLVNADEKNYDISLMKMPHHGGDTTIAFLNKFKPENAIISVGKGNNYGHPYKETLEMLKQADTKIFRTDQDGDIIVRSDGKRLTIKSSK